MRALWNDKRVDDNLVLTLYQQLSIIVYKITNPYVNQS